MIYPEYEQYKARYNDLQNIFASFLLEKESLFTKTLPNAIRYDKDRVQSSIDGNMLESYVIKLEDSRIDEKLDHVRQTLQDWEILLDAKERDLRKSQDKYDRIYTFKYLDGYGINKIAKILSYSKSQIYRMLKQIDKRCDKMRQNMC